MLRHRAPEPYHTIHNAIHTEILRADQDHAHFCNAEQTIFQQFLDREHLLEISDLRTFIQTVQQRIPSIEPHVMDIIRTREKQMLCNELRICRLRREALAEQMETLPLEISRGREWLMNDAMGKLEGILNGRIPERNTSREQKAVALSIIFRYPELVRTEMSGRRKRPKDTIYPRTPINHQASFAYFLVLAERERVHRYDDLRRHLALLYRWAWDRGISEAAQEHGLQRSHSERVTSLPKPPMNDHRLPLSSNDRIGRSSTQSSRTISVQMPERARLKTPPYSSIYHNESSPARVPQPAPYPMVKIGPQSPMSQTRQPNYGLSALSARPRKSILKQQPNECDSQKTPLCPISLNKNTAPPTLTKGGGVSSFSSVRIQGPRPAPPSLRKEKMVDRADCLGGEERASSKRKGKLRWFLHPGKLFKRSRA